MAVELEVRDGTPWWLSPDVWVVPGTDPDGPPGTPVVGQPAYLWARVNNTKGTTPVTNATVRFYWADPSIGFDRNTAHLVGTSYVTLAAGGNGTVLCLVPWVPEFVNDGHECILAEAFHATADPLPTVPAFNVQSDRHVAQRNLSVVQPNAQMLVVLPFVVVNAQRTPREFSVRLTQGRLGQLEPLRASLGKGFELPRREGKLRAAAFTDARCPDAADLKAGGAADGVSVKLDGHGRAARTLVARVEDGAALLHVEQWAGDQLVGGLSVLALGEPREGQDTPAAREDKKGRGASGRAVADKE